MKQNTVQEFVMIKVWVATLSILAGCVFPVCRVFAASDATLTSGKVSPSANSASLAVAGRYWRFSNRQFIGDISRDTGLLSKLWSCKPTLVDLIPNGNSGLSITLKNITSGKITQLNVLKSEKISLGEQNHMPFKRIECVIGSTQPEVATARIDYDIFNGHIGINIKITYDITDNHPYRIIVSQHFDSKKWPLQRYCWGPGKSTDATIMQYSYQRGERYNSKWGDAMYPMGMLLRRDRYFLWGYLNLHSYVVLAPNISPRRIPAFMINPKQIKKGDSYTFRFIYKITAPSWIVALRWYARHMYDSEPYFNEGPVRLTHTITRTMPEGNFVDYRMPHPGYSPKAYAQVQSMMLKLKLTNIWFRGWNNWRETAPTHGRWYNGHEFLSVASVRREIRNLHNKGFKVYLYFRQGWLFKSSELNSPEELKKPPYKRWLNRNSNGKFQILSEYPPSAAMRKTLGWKKGENLTWVETDFCNKQADAWYIKRVEKAVKAFHPDGIAWDMGWAPFKCPSTSDPDSNENEGMLRVQYRIYHWLHKHYPQDRVVSNLTLSSPADLYSDAVMIEGGVGGENNAMVENTAAYNVTSIGWLGANYTFGNAHGLELEREYIKRLMVGLGTGNSWGEGSYGYYQTQPHGTDQPQSVFYLQRWPWMLKLKQLAFFSAETNAVPWIADPKVIRTGSAQLTGAVWANPTTLLVSIYNWASGSKVIHVKINSDVVRKNIAASHFKKWVFHIIDSHGTALKNVNKIDTTTSDSYIVINGVLGPGELLLGHAVRK